MENETSKIYNPEEIEKIIYQKWEKSGYFNPDKLVLEKGAKNFCVMMAPVNITGNLHMGHAFENTLIDILVRMKRMEGQKTLWVPGTDHAGIATQNVVEKELKKQGKRREDLGREKFIEQVWQWREKYGRIILDQFKKLGLSCDWSRERFTMDVDYSKAVKIAFLAYYKKGWIYRGDRLVNWCPRCLTALSDLEIEYQERQGEMWYIKYPLKKIQNSKFKIQNSIVVATTRPETMLGDTAVAVNPQDQRYQKLIGKKVFLPLAQRKIPIIADRRVDMEFGTGAVKVTPAHDPLDFDIGKDNQLPSISVINKRGRMTRGAGKEYEGLKILEARQKVLNNLSELGLLEKSDSYCYKLSLCYRCHAPIEPLISRQWFLRMDELAKLAYNAVKSGKAKITPSKWNKPYFDWLSNIKDWCISRQIWWGHRLPVFYCAKKQEKIKNKKEKIKNHNKEKFIVALNKPKKCPFCGECKMRQSEEVLDTWFSSALWPFAALGWPKESKDLKEFYPTTLITSAQEILYLWQARMIFSGTFFTEKPPFKKLYIHPVVLTKQGQRMSKSLGTGIDPLVLVQKYGADATRFGLIWQTTGSQAFRFSEDHILSGQKFANKIWNAARFILLNKPKQISTDTIDRLTQITDEKLSDEDKKILNSSKTIIKETDNDIKNFRFGQALTRIYHFFWHQFCDQYLEASKKQIKEAKSETEAERTKTILLYILLTLIKLLHPFIPFVTEAVYQQLPLKKKKEFLMIEKWPCPLGQNKK